MVDSQDVIYFPCLKTTGDPYVCIYVRISPNLSPPSLLVTRSILRVKLYQNTAGDIQGLRRKEREYTTMKLLNIKLCPSSS